MKDNVKLGLICFSIIALTITALVVCGKVKPPWSGALIAIAIFLIELLLMFIGLILLVKGENMAKKKNWAVDLAEKTGKSRSAIYAHAQRLGRRPTLREVKNQRNGRPPKF